MADREFFLQKGLQLRARTVWCRFQPNGTEAPVLAASVSRGVDSVARSAAGKFLVTLKDGYYAAGPAVGTLQHASDATDGYVQCGAISNYGTSTPATIVVKVKGGSANKDFALASTTFVNVWIPAEDSTEA
jgi:hypothetical protein